MKEVELEFKSKKPGIIGKFWSKIPLLIKALLIGFIVNSIGVGTWVLSVSILPGFWPLALMAAFLWVYIKYFSGNWWPQSTSLFRKTNFRSTQLSRPLWKWGLISALLYVIVFQSGMMVTFRFIEYPAELFKAEYNFDSLSPVYAWIGLIMASIVAGICEETGFRGYMQVPLEKKYGSKVAIVIVSAVFVVVHLHQAWAWPILFQIFVASVFFGIIAYRTGSLIPSIIAHAVMDIFNFSYWWSDVLGKFEKEPVSISGVDGHFIFWTVVFLISTPLFMVSTAKAKNLRIKNKKG